MHLACFQACSNDAGVQRFARPYKAASHRPGCRLLMPDGAPVTKQSIRRALALVSRLYPLARPTRGMLKEVFNFFEPPHNVSAAAAVAKASESASAPSALPAIGTADGASSSQANGVTAQ